MGDRLLGQSRCVMIGAVLMALGHFLMSFEAPFLLALLCLILGSGFLKGNINTQVGRLYAPGDRRRTEAYQVFSIGINLGVVAAPLVCGTLGELYGWRFGFAAAGVGMLVSLAIYISGRRYLPPDEVRRAGQPRQRLAPGDGRVVFGLMVVLAVVTAFLTSIGQTGSIYLLWVKAYVDRSAFGFTVPATWFLSVTGLGSMLLPPLLLKVWRRQAVRGTEPGMVAKVGIGAGLAAVACLVLAALAASAQGGARVAWPWLLVFHLLVTLGYLYLWPVGMALFSRAAPAAISATMIGVYFLSSFASNLLIGWLGGFYERMSPQRFWLMQAAIGAAGALVILVLRAPLSRLLTPQNVPDLPTPEPGRPRSRPMSARQMKLFAFLWNTGAHVAAWRHPKASDLGLHSLAFYQGLAATAERGKMDAVFFADSSGFHQTPGADAFSRTDLVKLEPLTLLAALAVTTRNVGLVATASTTYSHAYTLARQFASLDHISGGRIGWNMVTSTAENEAHNYGLDHNVPHAERYERAAEFVEIVKALWDSFEDDAVVMDKASGRYLDPAKLHGLGHVGKFYKVEGPLNVARPPQGHPVLVQAGSSDTGRAFAARFAEAVFTSHPAFETARDFYGDLKRQVAELGRDPDGVKILPSVQPVVGATEGEAKRMEEELDALMHSDLTISLLERTLGGVDLRACDPDGPLPDIPPTENARSTRQRIVDWATRDKLSIRQIAHKVAAQRTSHNLVGAPEQVADRLEHWFTHGAADGFVLGMPWLPGGLDVFVDEVIPILQTRGLFRTEYEGPTLRENLGLRRPPNNFQVHPERHREPAIW